MIEEIKKEIQDIAKSTALDTFLSEWEGDPDQVFENIEKGEVEDILIWQPFEHRDGDDLSSLIGVHYDCEMKNYKEVVAKVKQYLVSRAKDGSLPRDMNELDLTVLF